MNPDLEHPVVMQLRDATADVQGGPDLRRAIDTGRARRRRRGFAASGAAAVAVAGLATAAVMIAPGSGSGGAPADEAKPDDSFAGGPEPRSLTAPGDPGDYVAGTRIDDRMAAAIADRLPTLGAPDDVYPSDWETAGPLPDAQFPQATDWQAAYTLGDDDSLLVLMGYPKPGEPGTCDGDVCTPGPRGGQLLTQSFRSNGEKTYGVYYTAADGFGVSVMETVPRHAPRSLTDKQLKRVAVDARLHFDAPTG